MEGMSGIRPSAVASQESSRPSPRPRTLAGVSDSGGHRVEHHPSTESRSTAQLAPEPGVTEQLAAGLTTALEQVDGDFSVSVDRDTGMIVVRITDVATGEIVKQIPPQELMDADLNMEKIVGLLVDDEG